MTGEMTLRGLVLPVGGIKEKVIAAHRAGFAKVLLPLKNKKDLAGLPKHIKNGMDIALVENMEEVLDHAFQHVFEDLHFNASCSSKL